MRLQNFFQAAQNAQDDGQFLAYGVEVIAADKELASHIQEVLIWLKFLDPPVDGKFGPISLDALTEFQNAVSSIRPKVAAERGFLGIETARALIEIGPDVGLLPKIDYSLNNLAAKLIKYMAEMKYQISLGDKKYNIIYAEGMDASGKLNNDAPNQFNDLRLVIEIPQPELQPVVRGKWEATTEPGTHYTLNPVNQRGAARIAFGQFRSWRVGTHYGSGAEPHEALIQEEPLSVYRDANQDGMRTGDFLDTGLFGINQHWGFDLLRNDIGFASAGCLVGRTRAGHREFMALIKQDKRYQRNNKYLFHTTIVPGDNFVAKFP